MIADQLTGARAEPHEEDAGEDRVRRELRSDREERRDRSGSALVHVRGPHVEGRRRDLEEHAATDEDDPDDEERRRLRRREGRGDPRERERSRRAVDERDPVNRTPDENAPSTKYFAAASRDFVSRLKYPARTYCESAISSSATTIDAR